MRLSNNDVLLHWPLAQHIITVETPNNPRALPAEELAAAVAKVNPSVEAADSIAQAVEGNRIGHIGNAVQEHCEKRGFSVVREMTGHGIGRKLHEEPAVPNYGRRGVGPLIKEGMCIAIEPMINMGSRNIVIERDGWTCRTKDRKPSAHFEHTVAIRGGKAEILSSFEFIEGENQQ